MKWIFVLAIFVSACTSKVFSPVKTAVAGVSAVATPIQIPQSDRIYPFLIDQVVLVAHQRRLYFLASKHPEHSNAQIREMDTQTLKDRRVTWQDGDIESFDVRPGDHMVYSSTTDEIKERLHPLERPASQGMPAEIYIADRFGEDIDRLTNHPGFDGQCSFSGNGSQIIYVSKTDKGDAILRFNHLGQQPKVIVKARAVTRTSPAISADDDLAWLEHEDDSNLKDVRILGQATPFFTIRRPIRWIHRLHENEGWLALEHPAAGGSRLFYFSTECEKTVYEDKAQIVAADVADDFEHIVIALEYAGNTAGTRLSWKPVDPNSFTCEIVSKTAKISP